MEYGDITTIKEYISYLSKRKPTVSVDPLASIEDVDLVMELVKRGYAVHLPLENVDRLK